jgi:HAMP domain-containing protein/CheY-like chemotaxis protein/signal transduction histidine kinase
LSDEVSELRQTVGLEGRTHKRLSKSHARGGWSNYVNGVNGLLDDVTAHTADVARVLTAVAKGDLTQTIDIDGHDTTLRGDFLRHARIVNGMVAQLAAFSSEVTRVAQEVGTEGKLGAQARIRGVAGVWKELTDSVNLMASNLTAQVREIARVTTAVAGGDLTKTVSIDAKGEILALKNTINTMVEQLSSFASEVTRVAREVGTEGVLGGQAQVRGVSGVWRELTQNVNSMANNLTIQVRNIAEVSTAIAAGDLSRKITVDVKGELLGLKNTINTMVDQLGAFSGEVTRVAREVGTEGMLGGQAEVRGVSGVWRELTENVNSMASNLTSQVRNIAEVITAMAEGDLGHKITVDARGEILTLKNTINATVDKLNRFAAEVNRMARLVGTEGTLGVQADVRDVSGVWRELTDNVNLMGRNLTDQVRDIASVTTSVANGDLSKKITVDVKGELLELKNTINAMVDSLGSFASEVSRMAREVGTEGVLGGQAVVRDVSGIWAELTQNVNSMANNLTNQVRNIAEVARAVATGDLSKKITVGARGEVLELKSILNAMVDQLNAFSEEVTRVAREVGTEGKLGGQAEVAGVRGVWKELTDNVNLMASNLTNQVRDIATVTTAVAKGDLTRQISVDAKGEFLELKSTINTMVDQLSAFADQVTRVSREVGTEGKLGGQASIEGVRGVWKELTDNVNLMGSNLTNQVRDISQVATAIAQGDLSRKITVEVRGELLDLKNVINTMVDQLSGFAEQVTRVAREVGVEGRLGGQAEVRGVLGVWKELTDNVNLMASNLTGQVRDIATVTTAVANGDLTRKITVDVKGELLELKRTINTMVDQLNAFSEEVTRVAREVGTEGKLGGQAEVRGVSGVWRDLTDNVNLLARNLTEQVRGIARVVTAVANGSLDQKLTLSAKGEIGTLVDTINAMTVTLSTFAEQVTGVARDVGVEGKLGGQADVPGAAGVWRDLTNNVNELAGNLTRQVRAIGDVATAVTKGDLTQSITVDARGEVALLKDNVNQMIGTLAETTRLNQEQDWLKTNLARFTRMLQGQRDLLTVADQVLTELAEVVNAQHGSFFMAEQDEHEEEPKLKLFASYAYQERKSISNLFHLGEGLVGQSAREKKRILVTDVPDDYVRVSSSLGEAAPRNIVVVPISFEGEIKGVLELASFQRFTPNQLAFLEQLVESLGIVVATITATMRTDELLRQSQSMAEELQSQQEELQQTNEELEEKARQLTAQKSEVERKNVEVELAKQELEEKAEQLTVTSRYKSQFLANMSHELRTPLNSLLILSKQLTDNREGNLSPKQLEFSRTIHQSGADLLALINEILDLAKIESGTMSVDVVQVAIAHLSEYVERSFRHVADDKRLQFEIIVARGVPETIETDEMRLRQLLRNLISNALKFTERGHVRLTVFVPERAEWSVDNESLNRAKLVLAFAVSDTGIGVPKDKQRIIFEPFQQADGGTSRKYGGTGLGLAISREIAGLLGGELRLQSEVGVGSTFTFYLPAAFPHAGRKSQPSPIPAVQPALQSTSLPPTAAPAADDRAQIATGDRVLLIIEDDEAFGRTVLGMVREHGFRGVVAKTGAQGLEFARTLQPHAITLDLRLPDMDGWVVLDQLKHTPATRHIPVHVISAADDLARGLEVGAIAVLQKPVSPDALDSALATIERFLARRVRRLLVVEDDTTQRNSIVELIGSDDGDVQTTAVASGEAALEALAEHPFDCMVLDLKLPGISGVELIKRVKDNPAWKRTPIIVYTGKELTREEDTELRRTTDTVIVKDVKSPERLLDETALFLHRVEAKLPTAQRQMLRRLSESDPALAGKRVLVVDDDARNLFAITTILEQHDMRVSYAENGQQALDSLANATEPFDIVLMDVMMPEMDGYEATRRIRAQREYERLPIIALTAKAMQGDREKCIQAGASDYITKPVDADQLVSLLRVWLYR